MTWTTLLFGVAVLGAVLWLLEKRLEAKDKAEQERERLRNGARVAAARAVAEAKVREAARSRVVRITRKDTRHG